MAKYELGEIVGRGGMGQVHATHDRHGRAVVVKRLRKTLLGNRSIEIRLADEGRLLERVIHHNVARVLDRGEADGSPFVVMDRAPGISLAALIDRDGPLSQPRAFAIASQLLAGLAAIHEARVVHADIKSSNVLVDANDRVTIIDFGLARTWTIEPDREQVVAGTPAFMAPEVIAGKPPTLAADIYAAGVILYEMLTGATPFALAHDIFSAHLSDPVVAPSLRAPERAISHATDRMILRALSKQPDQRFASAREFAAALDEVAARTWAVTTQYADRSVHDRETVVFGRAELELLAEQRAPTVRRDPAAPVAAAEHTTIATALERAQQRIERRDVHGAIPILESAVADLETCPEAWRLETVLAALYDSLGKKQRARRIALAAYRNAVRTGSTVAVGRAEALLARIEKPPTPEPRMRFAKGSAQFKVRR